MAAVTDVQLVNITVNGIPLQVPRGELIVESVKRVGLEIPIFCYHPRMKPVGMCRMCLIEIGTKGPDGSVRMMPKPQAACSLPASEGLVIVTDSERLHQDRRGVLEFMLINHPLDCPVCDRGGECPLQNNTLYCGPSTSRYIEVKRHAPKAFPLSQYVTLDLERCIQCGRCVRFTEEISGDAQLALRFRGAKTQPGTFELRQFTSKFSGNVIEICPVGALTSTKYRFRARPWDLQTRPSICTGCSVGCNVHFDYRGDRYVRMNGRTNEAVNEEWTCDKGKFGNDFYNSDKRIANVLIRRDDKLVPTEWADAYSALLGAFNDGKGSEVAVLGGVKNSNEDLYALKKLFTEGFGSPNLDHRFQAFAATSPVSARTGIASYETAPSILVFGSSLADEAPVLFLRVRKAWYKNGAKVVIAHSTETDVDQFAHLKLRYNPGTAHHLALGLLAAQVASGTATVGAELAKLLGGYTPEKTSELTGVPAASITAAAELIAGSPIITTKALFDDENGAAAAEALASLKGEFNSYGVHANDTGAELLGVVPGAEGKDTKAILEGCVDGSIKALWLLGIDPFQLVADRALVEKALENVEFLVVQDLIETEATAFASVVLPMAAPAEMEGTYTNLEGRVQRTKAILPVKGSARPAWRVFEELSLRLSPKRPLYNPSDVTDELAAKVSAFAGLSYAAIPEEGFVLA